MAGSGAVDIFLVYQFLKRLAQPFTSWDAYKEGVIDREGNIKEQTYTTTGTII